MRGSLCIISRRGFIPALMLSVLTLLILPTRPLAETKAKRGHETSRILETLQSSGTELAELGEPSAWELADTIWRESKKHSIDPMLVLAIIRVESQFRPRVVSIQGARGLMQLHPAVAHSLAEQAELEKWEGEQSLDNPVINVKLGVTYLGSLKEKFGDLRLVLTAYNRGPTWVQKRLEEKTALPLDYARKVLTVSRNYRQQSNG